MLTASGQLDLQPADGSLIRHRDILVNFAGNLHEPSTKRQRLPLLPPQCSASPELAARPGLPEFTSVTGKTRPEHDSRLPCICLTARS